MHLPLRAALKAKIEAPGMNFANIEGHGCGDASLYGRFYKAGLMQVKYCFSSQLSTVPTRRFWNGFRIASSPS
jgi:hypothetical protein